jgi:hypothetical protein
MLGGIGLIVCGVLGMLQSSVPEMSRGPALAVVIGLVYAAAVLVFAIGTTPQASVVGRRPLGVTSIAILAVWPLVDIVATAFLPQDGTSLGAWTTYGYVTLLVQTSAALVAAMQIARAGIVPAPWRWAPLWVLGFQAFAWAVPQIVVVSVGPVEIQRWADLYMLLGAVAGLVGTLGLGILALVLAAQQRPETVEVFRSA